MSKYNSWGITPDRILYVDYLVSDDGTLTAVDTNGGPQAQIPNRVRKIGMGALSGMENLNWVYIPNSISSIDDYAFNGLTGLSEVRIPDSVIHI